MKSGRYLLLTECSMGDNIAAENPDREMLRLCSVRCPHMNEITLEETLASLRKEQYQVEVPGADGRAGAGGARPDARDGLRRFGAPPHAR